MKFLAAASLFALAEVALSATTHKVTVSNMDKQLIFAPNVTTASAGDMVEFVFYPMNHSVVQASLLQPCQPLAGNKGFYSGYVPSTSGAASTSFLITVNDTKPIWFYCSQGDHCQDGMVGAINPPAANSTNSSITAFAAASKLVPKTTVPDFKPQGGNLTMNAQASGTTMSPSATSTSTSTASPSPSSGARELTVGAAAGVFGAVAAVFAAVL